MNQPKTDFMSLHAKYEFLVIFFNEDGSLMNDDQNNERKKVQIRAAGGIVWREGIEPGEPEFLLLLHRHGHYWSFPKGRRNKGETDLETAKREIREETGIDDFTLLERGGNLFSSSVRYFVRRGKSFIPKEVRYFLVKFSKKVEVSLSREHIAYKWLKFDDAIANLSHRNSKELLTKVYSDMKPLDDDDDEFEL